jgi:hypothetical protein
MDRIKYDVRIQNVSGQRVPFPWSPSPIAQRDRPATGYRHALFEFLIVRANQPNWAVDTFVLYGAPTVAGSVRELLPGEVVTVRLAAVLSGNGPHDSNNPILHPAAGTQVKVGMVIWAPGDERFRVFHEELSRQALALAILPSDSGRAGQ